MREFIVLLGVTGASLNFMSAMASLPWVHVLLGLVCTLIAVRYAREGSR